MNPLRITKNFWDNKLSPKYFSLIFVALILSACGSVVPEKGEYFNTSIFAQGNSAWYEYFGEYKGMGLYTSREQFQKYHPDAGLLVKDGRVYKAIAVDELFEIKKEMVANIPPSSNTKKNKGDVKKSMQTVKPINQVTPPRVGNMIINNN